MTDRLIDIDWIAKTSLEVHEQTLQKYGVGYNLLTEIIDIFFNLSHFLKESIDPETDKGAFINIAYSTYLRLPYTLYNIRNLWSNGFYLESIILIRHIVEGFACLRYFSTHKDKVKKHYTARRSRDRVTFKTMFDEVSPGFYDKIYPIFSQFAHGGILTIGTRVNYRTASDGDALIGCVFSDLHCRLIIDQTPTYSYGYLCFLKDFFPTIDSRLPDDLNIKYIDVKAELNCILNSKREKNEAMETWSTTMKPFVEK